MPPPRLPVATLCFLSEKKYTLTNIALTSTVSIGYASWVLQSGGYPKGLPSHYSTHYPSTY